MSVDDQFGQSENLPAEMEGVAESGLLSLFRRQRLHRLQVEVVVQMQVVQILAVNQQIQHVVALSQHLKNRYFIFILKVFQNSEKKKRISNFYVVSSENILHFPPIFLHF